MRSKGFKCMDEEYRVMIFVFVLFALFFALLGTVHAAIFYWDIHKASVMGELCTTEGVEKKVK